MEKDPPFRVAFVSLQSSSNPEEHEQLHRRFHDDAAGERISWWLRQRDIAGGYAKTNGVLVGGPSVEGLDRRTGLAKVTGRDINRRTLDHRATLAPPGSNGIAKVS